MKRFFYILIFLMFAVPALAIEDVPDGSFENFDDTWQCDDNCINPSTFYIVAGTAAQGSFYAYIFHEAGLYQDLTIPSTATSISFQYDNQTDSDETGSFTVSLTDVTTAEVYASQVYSEQSDDWITGSLDIPASAQGQTVRLLLSNDTGANRIDALEFATGNTSDDYATIKVQIFNAAGDPINHATVFIKKKGTKISLFNLKTEETVTTVHSNKKGRTPNFQILRDLSSDGTVQLCVKKKTTKECAVITPATGVKTSYAFSFSSI